MGIELDYLRWNFAFNFLRYLFGAGIFFVLLFYILARLQPQARINPDLTFPKNQILRELSWSMSSCMIFVIATYFFMVVVAGRGWTLLYADIHTYGYAYYLFSIIFCVFLHDLNFYLVHRLFHTSFLMKHAHYVHHSFKNPTAFAIWAVHPLEAVAIILIAFLPIFILPLHVTAFFTYVLITQFFNLLGHGGVEIFPRKLNTHRLFRYLNSPTHHTMHHHHSHYSFGLYSRIWDTLFKTNHPNYEDEFLKYCIRRKGKNNSPAQGAGVRKPIGNLRNS